MAPPLGSQERARRAGAVRNVMASRGAGWGVAACLAGVIVGFAVGHATAQSTTIVASGGPITAVPFRQVVGQPGPAGGLPAGKAYALPSGKAVINLPGGGKAVVFPAAPFQQPMKMLSPYAVPQCGPFGAPVHFFGPGNRLRVIAPGMRRIFVAPGMRRILVGPGGVRWIQMGPGGRMTVHVYGAPQRRGIVRLWRQPGPAINWVQVQSGRAFNWLGAPGGPGWVAMPGLAMPGGGPGCGFGPGAMFQPSVYGPPFGAPLPPAVYRRGVVVLPGKP
jgi:hypothetical protein